MRTFAVSDLVVVPAHGVGEIVAIEPFRGEDMYTVYFAREGMTYRVSVQKTGTMRPLVDKKSLHEALHELTRTRKRAKGLWGQRLKTFREMLNSGDIKTLCILTRNLFTTEEERLGGKQSHTERIIFEDAFTRVVDECVAVAKLDHMAAAALVDEALATKKLPKEFVMLNTGH